MFAKLMAILAKDPSVKTNIVSEIKGNRFWITFNRPKRYNAFTSDMYVTLKELILYGNEHKDIKFIVINGKGGSYSSGNDLSNFTKPEINEMGNT